MGNNCLHAKNHIKILKGKKIIDYLHAKLSQKYKKKQMSFKAFNLVSFVLLINWLNILNAKDSL